jgi:hypothetical protein
MVPRNRFQGMNSASLAGRYDKPIPPRFLAPIDCLDRLKIPALAFLSVEIQYGGLEKRKKQYPKRYGKAIFVLN